MDVKKKKKIYSYFLLLTAQSIVYFIVPHFVYSCFGLPDEENKYHSKQNTMKPHRLEDFFFVADDICLLAHIQADMLLKLRQLENYARR